MTATASSRTTSATSTGGWAQPPASLGRHVRLGGRRTPEGFLLCDGTAVSRETYADLFLALGTIWGAGDGRPPSTSPTLRARPSARARGRGSAGARSARRAARNGTRSASPRCRRTTTVTSYCIAERNAGLPVLRAGLPGNAEPQHRDRRDGQRLEPQRHAALRCRHQDHQDLEKPMFAAQLINDDGFRGARSSPRFCPLRRSCSAVIERSLILAPRGGAAIFARGC